MLHVWHRHGQAGQAVRRAAGRKQQLRQAGDRAGAAQLAQPVRQPGALAAAAAGPRRQGAALQAAQARQLPGRRAGHRQARHPELLQACQLAEVVHHRLRAALGGAAARQVRERGQRAQRLHVLRQQLDAGQPQAAQLLQRRGVLQQPPARAAGRRAAAAAAAARVGDAQRRQPLQARRRQAAGARAVVQHAQGAAQLQRGQPRGPGLGQQAAEAAPLRPCCCRRSCCISRLAPVMQLQLAQRGRLGQHLAQLLIWGFQLRRVAGARLQRQAHAPDAGEPPAARAREQRPRVQLGGATKDQGGAVRRQARGPAPAGAAGAEDAAVVQVRPEALRGSGVVLACYLAGCKRASWQHPPPLPRRAATPSP